MGTLFQFPYRTVAEVSLRAAVKNLYTLRALCGKEMLPVVKADAYGHGMIPVSKALANRGSCRMIAVATLEEAIELRRHMEKIEILVLSGFFPHQIEAYLGFRLTPMIHSLSHLKSLIGRKPLPPVHLKIESGMNRLGIQQDQVPEAVTIVRSFEDKLAGLATHFADSEDLRSDFIDKQIETFESILEHFQDQRLLCTDARIHTANTGAVMRGKCQRSNAVRTGIGIYGISLNQNLEGTQDLIPVLEWKTRILTLKEVPKGETIGYGRTYQTSKPELIAILPIGYADGYPRLLSNQGHVLVNGKKCPVRGRVSMDLSAIDVSGVSQVREGQAVSLIGPNGHQEITAWDVARWSDTLPYEILCGISPRVPRVYLD